MNKQTGYKCMFILLITTFLNIITSPSLYGTSGIPKSLELLLPSNLEIPRWEKKGPARIYEKEQLYEYIDGGAALFFEYGFKRTITQEYSDGEESLTVDIYEMNDPEAAFGIYSLQRDYKIPALNVGNEGTQYDDRVAFWQSCYYIVTIGQKSGKGTKMVLFQLAENISKRIGSTSQEPKMFTHLPVNGLVPRSKVYFKGPLGLNSQFYLTHENVLEIDGIRTEGVLGAYQSSGEEARLLIIRYPNSQKAEEKKQLVSNIFSSKHKRQIVDGIPIFKNNKGRYYSVKTTDHFLYVIFEASSLEMTNEVLKQTSQPVPD